MPPGLHAIPYSLLFEVQSALKQKKLGSNLFKRFELQSTTKILLLNLLFLHHPMIVFKKGGMPPDFFCLDIILCYY